MLGHERFGQLDLRTHDVEAVLLEHELRRLPVSETLPLTHKVRQPAL